MKVIDILHETSLKLPDNPVIFDERGILNYAELYQEVSSLGEKLQKLGVKEGFYLGLSLEDSREFIIYLFAASFCGATVVPLGINLDDKEFNELLKVLSIDGLIHRGNRNNDRIEIEKDIYFSSLNTAPENNKAAFPGAAFIRPTSGTTGPAKGVVFTHASIIERIDNALEGLEINSSDRILWVLPMAYHFIVSIILYVRAGAAVIIPKYKSSENLISLANKHNASVLYAGPMDFISLAEAEGAEKLPVLKWSICTVGGVSALLAEKFNKRHSNILRQVYGMIEVGLALGNVSKTPDPIDSVGKVMKGFEVNIVNAAGLAVKAGETGRFLIKGKGLFDGYYNPCKLREEITQNGWFDTGDLVSYDDRGNFYIAGREKSKFTIEGKEVFSEEVESILNDHPSIKISRVYLSESINSKKGITAEVEFIKDLKISDEDLLNFCTSKLEMYKIPSRFIALDKIALTATGKVLRHDK